MLLYGSVLAVIMTSTYAAISNIAGIGKFFVSGHHLHSFTGHISTFKIRHWRNFNKMNGNDLDQWVIYIPIKIMLGKDLHKSEIFMPMKTTIGKDQVSLNNKLFQPVSDHMVIYFRAFCGIPYAANGIRLLTVCRIQAMAGYACSNPSLSPKCVHGFGVARVLTYART